MAEATRLTGLGDLRDDRATMPVPDAVGTIVGQAPVPIAVVSDNGPCFRGDTFAQAFTGHDPLLRHVRTRVRSPQTNWVVERFFGTLKYEHLYRAMIRDGDALSVEVNWFRQVYNTIRPHQALATAPRTRPTCNDLTHHRSLTEAEPVTNAGAEAHEGSSMMWQNSATALGGVVRARWARRRSWRRISVSVLMRSVSSAAWRSMSPRTCGQGV